MIGTRLGQYRIDALIGQGGMGAVYLATDEMLGRQVAIKVLREDADPEGSATERFRSEAQILSRLDHPYILRLYGFSRHEGVLYMVTEFVRGEALQRRLERGAILDTGQVLEWAGQVLDALDYAHELGVVHRDIKPANILIDERNRARLLDFGIARIVGTEGLTQTGHAVGTLAYMAPEQVLDEAIDGRADLYAFAVVLCQMLAGRRPYRATTTAGLIREIVDGPAPDVAVLLPPHAAAFAPALLHALARRPADRTPTAALMRQELMAVAVASPGVPIHVASGEPTVGGAPHAPATAGAIPSPPPVPLRRRPGAIAYVVPAMLLLSGLGLAWYLRGPSRLVTPRVAMAPADTSPARGEWLPAERPTTTPAEPAVPAPLLAEPPVAATAPSTTSAAPPAAAPAARPTPGTARTSPPGQRTAAAAGPAPALSAALESELAPTTAPAPAPASESAPSPEPAPDPAPAPAAVPATVEFTDIILMDRVDDEDEELDVSVRLDARRVVVIDEDGIAKRSIAYEAIGRASYNTRKPGRFSLRRGPSHWLTLEVGTTPIVLRLNAKTYEQVLTTLAGHGVPVERNP